MSLIAQKPAVTIRASDSQGARVVEKRTETSVIENYLQSWKSLRDAFDANQPAALDSIFVGVAQEKLVDAVAAQSRLGIRTHYQDLSHDLQIVFYSPDGLSIQLIDHVRYRQQVLEKDKAIADEVVQCRYVVVLTPSDTRWQVRIMQASKEP